MTAAPAFRAGDACGQYVIVDLVSSGGIGEVYRAEQPSVGRQVAIKCLQFRHADRDDLRARMAMEGQALGRISHPNMVTVFDAGCSDSGVIWIAMELLVGQTLREILNDRGRLAVDEAIACAVDVAEAVGAAHREMIVHRDIKPENVFVTEHGVVKVLDLGTAKLQGWGELKTTERGRILGTPAYMSPEQIRCIRIDERSDIYALGVMLYEMLGGHPFGHLVNLNDHYELAKMQLFGEPRPLPLLVPEVSAQVDRVIQKAIAKDPADRYGAMLELANDLRTAIGLVTPAIRGSVRPAPKPSDVPPSSSSLGPHGTLRIAQDRLLPAPALALPPSVEHVDVPSIGYLPSTTNASVATEVRAPMRWWALAILSGGVLGGIIGGAVLIGFPAAEVPALESNSAPVVASSDPVVAPSLPPPASASAEIGRTWPSEDPVVRPPPTGGEAVGPQPTTTAKDEPTPAKPPSVRPPTVPPQPTATRSLPGSGL